jgi:hypothetical protein
MDFAQRACAFFLKSDGKLEQTGLEAAWISCLVSYARCFNSAAGRNAKLNIHATLKGQRLETDVVQLHKFLMETRNSLIAHAGLNPGEHIYAVQVAEPNGKIEGMAPIAARGILPERALMEAVLYLCGLHLKWIDSQIGDVAAATAAWIKEHNAQMATKGRSLG